MNLFWKELRSPVLKCQRVGHRKPQEIRDFVAYPAQIHGDAILENREGRREICLRCKMELLPWEVEESSPSASLSAVYKDISTAPTDGTRVDLWLVIESVQARRKPESVIVADCWYENGEWVHSARNRINALHFPSIIGWRAEPIDKARK